MARMRLAYVLPFLLSAVAVRPTQALLVAPATFEELVRESAAVVYGRVHDVRAAWTPDRRTITTVVTLDAIEHFKGTETDTTTFTVPGGEAGGQILVVPGAPTFRQGDAVVVFLRGSAPAIPTPVGLSLGVYRVSARPTDGTLMVVPTPVHAAAVAGPVRRGSLDRAPRTLARFGDDVRALGGGR